MDTKRVYYLMLGVTGFLGCLIIVAAFLGSSMLKKQSDKLLDAKLQNAVLVEQLKSLARASKDVEKYSELEKISKVLVPQDKDQAATVRQIVKIAADSGVSIGSVSFPTSTLGQTTPKAEAGTTTKAAPITQVKPAVGLPGLYTMEIAVQHDGSKPISYAKFIDFLSRLEQNRRTAQVSSITVKPSGPGVDQLVFSLIVNVYIKP